MTSTHAGGGGCEPPQLSQTSRPFCSMVQTIVVLDHHRASNEVIDNAVLSYVEPYASSTCEMVAEVLQYIADGIKVTACRGRCHVCGNCD